MFQINKLTVLRGIKDKLDRTGHVMFTFTLTHVIHGTIDLVRMVGNVTVFFFASHFVG